MPIWQHPPHKTINKTICVNGRDSPIVILIPTADYNTGCAAWTVVAGRMSPVQIPSARGKKLLTEAHDRPIFKSDDNTTVAVNG